MVSMAPALLVGWAGGLPAAPVLAPGAELPALPRLWLSSPLCDCDLESRGFEPLPRSCFSVVNTAVPRAPWWAEPADAGPGVRSRGWGRLLAPWPHLVRGGLPPTAAALALEGGRDDCKSRRGMKDSPWGSSDGSWGPGSGWAPLEPRPPSWGRCGRPQLCCVWEPGPAGCAEHRPGGDALRASTVCAHGAWATRGTSASSACSGRPGRGYGRISEPRVVSTRPGPGRQSQWNLAARSRLSVGWGGVLCWALWEEGVCGLALGQEAGRATWVWFWTWWVWVVCRTLLVGARRLFPTVWARFREQDTLGGCGMGSGWGRG